MNTGSMTTTSEPGEGAVLACYDQNEPTGDQDEATSYQGKPMNCIWINLARGAQHPTVMIPEEY